MYSDGVSDNLYEQAIVKCVSYFVDGLDLKDPEEASITIANCAYRMSKTKNFYSPWVRKANKAGAGEFVLEEGRADDITVICA